MTGLPPPTVSFPCPYCGKNVDAYADGTPGVAHPLPHCFPFSMLHPLDYMIATRHIRLAEAQLRDRGTRMGRA